MKRIQTLMAVPLLAGLMFVTGCDNDDEPAPPSGPTNTATAAPATAARTNTSAPTAPPTNTSAPTAPPTNTAVPATNTPTHTNTPAEDTPVPTETSTPGGDTPVPTETPTSEPEATPTATGGAPAVCGDEVTDAAAGEECDDGNNYGADGCAANCTFESDITLDFGTGTTTQSSSTVQTGLFALVLNITGKQVITHGQARTQVSEGADGFTNFKPGELPIATLTSKNQEDGIGFIDPIIVPGLVCACIRGLELQTCGGRPAFPGNTDPNNGTICNDDPSLCDGSPDGACIPAFGPAVSGAGRVGCVDGLQGEDYRFISYKVVADSLTEDFTLTPEGDSSIPGAAFNLSYTAIGTIMDSGTCSIDESDPRKGPDGIPCTDDDPAESRGAPSATLQTTGMATANVLNVNNQTGKNIEAGVNCGAAPCIVSVQGAAVSCENLAAGNTGGLCLASAFSALDQPSTGDYANTARFCALAQ